jgi:hypothetical protein
MPKLYEYFGLGINFFSREHEPIHVHGRYQDREMKADIYIDQGKIVKILIKPIPKKKPLQEPQLSDFEKVVHQYAQDIVRKWADFFLFGKKIECTQIKRRIK